MSYYSVEEIRDNIISDVCEMAKGILALNNSELSFLIVINSDGKVVGTVTDGDVRRGLINGVCLSNSVSKFMQKNYLCGREHENDHQRKFRSISGATPFLPIIDLKGRLVSVYCKVGSASEITSAVVMAGGFGKRLGQLTQDKPKPLVEVQGKALIEHVLTKLEQVSIKEIFITTHFQSEKIEKYIQKRKNLASIQLIKEETPLGTAGSLKNIHFGPNNRKFLMINCDVISGLDFNHFFQYGAAEKSDILLAVSEYSNQLQYGVVSINHNKEFVEIVEKPTQKFFIASGVYLLSACVADLIGVGQRIDMPQLINIAKERGYKVDVFPLHEQWVDLGQKKDIEQFERASSK